jgi:hypothetical protein
MTRQKQKAARHALMQVNRHIYAKAYLFPYFYNTFDGLSSHAIISLNTYRSPPRPLPGRRRRRLCFWRKVATTEQTLLSALLDDVGWLGLPTHPWLGGSANPQYQTRLYSSISG